MAAPVSRRAWLAVQKCLHGTNTYSRLSYRHQSAVKECKTLDEKDEESKILLENNFYLARLEDEALQKKNRRDPDDHHHDAEENNVVSIKPPRARLPRSEREEFRIDILGERQGSKYVQPSNFSDSAEITFVKGMLKRQKMLTTDSEEQLSSQQESGHVVQDSKSSMGFVDEQYFSAIDQGIITPGTPEITKETALGRVLEDSSKCEEIETNNFIESQYFQETDNIAEVLPLESASKHKNVTPDDNNVKKSEPRLSDAERSQRIWETQTVQQNTHLCVTGERDESFQQNDTLTHVSHEVPLSGSGNIIEDQYFPDQGGDPCVPIKSQTWSTDHEDTNVDLSWFGVEGKNRVMKNVTPQEKRVQDHKDEVNQLLEDWQKLTVTVPEMNDLDFERSSYKGPNKNQELTEAQTAALEIRSEIKKEDVRKKPLKRDSWGKVILNSTIPKFDYMTTAEIASLLKDNVMYNENDIVVINKPYGLNTHGGPGVKTSLGHVKKQLAKLVDHRLDDLYIVHRLDKDTSGILLMAKTAEMCHKLSTAFQEKRVIKKYLAVTKTVPNPPQGIIDIPIMEGSVEGKQRMVLSPDFNPDGTMRKSSSRKKMTAVTQYRVLSKNLNCALIECSPLTGIKHQIRVHLSFGLGAPILGDHKYAHLTKFAPQTLSAGILHRLGTRQSKVRHIPMHLHCASVVIPEFLNGKNFYVRCPIPFHISRTLNKLKLTLKN